MFLKFTDYEIASSEIQQLEHIGGGFYKVKWGHVEAAVKYTRDTLDLKVTEQETNIVAKLRHPRLMFVYGICYYLSNRGIVSECAEQRLCDALDDLRNNFIARSVSYPQSQWMLDAASAVTYLHNCGITHRNINSASFFIKDGRLKLGDYEFATTAEYYKPYTDEIADPRWHAPECIISRHEMDKNSDVYSLGVVLWEISTLLVPFLCSSALEVAELKKKKVHPEIPIASPYFDIISSCWVDVPEQRPPASKVYDYLLKRFRKDAQHPARSSVIQSHMKGIVKQVAIFLPIKDIEAFCSTCRYTHRLWKSEEMLQTILGAKYNKFTKELTLKEMKALVKFSESKERIGVRYSNSVSAAGLLGTMSREKKPLHAVLTHNCILKGKYLVTWRVMTEEIPDYVPFCIFHNTLGLSYLLLEHDIKILNSEQQWMDVCIGLTSVRFILYFLVLFCVLFIFLLFSSYAGTVVVSTSGGSLTLSVGRPNLFIDHAFAADYVELTWVQDIVPNKH